MAHLRALILRSIVTHLNCICAYLLNPISIQRAQGKECDTTELGTHLLSLFQYCPRRGSHKLGPISLVLFPDQNKFKASNTSLLY